MYEKCWKDYFDHIYSEVCYFNLHNTYVCYFLRWWCSYFLLYFKVLSYCVMCWFSFPAFDLFLPFSTSPVFHFLISPIYLNLCFSITLCQFCFVICLCSCSISLHLSWFLCSPCFFGCYPPLLPFMRSSPSLPHLASSLLSPHLFLVLSLVSVFSLCVSFTPCLVIVFVCPCSCPLFRMFWFWVFHVMQQQRRATKQPGGE